ncbi:hypothetical protein [Methylocella sp.]|jgi:hypothetical protein|uniref:hypothetical protein n=1 Tax=Methylocella sp. TaxID=1978226 RepID=UPI003C1EED98
MTPLERKFHRAAVKNKKERLEGIHNEVCLGCAADLRLGKEDDHMIGRKHGDLVWPLCKPCHRKRSELQREEPPATDTPRNLLGIIGRWLLSVAEYFELMRDTFRRFGEYLIELARQGYGAELTLP